MVKLKSGREIDPKPLTWENMAWVKDQSLKYYNEKIPISLYVCGNCLLFAKVIDKLDFLLDWSDEEVYEAANKIIEENTLQDTQKKS